MKVKEAINDWHGQTGGFVKNGLVQALTEEFSKRLSENFDGLNVQVYACKPPCQAAAIFVKVTLPEDNPKSYGMSSEAEMKLVQFAPSVKCKGGRRYEKWTVYRPVPSELYCRFHKDMGPAMWKNEDFELADYVRVLKDYLVGRNERYAKAAEILARYVDDGILDELRTPDSTLLRKYSK